MKMLITGTRRGRADVDDVLRRYLGHNGWGVTRGFRDLAFVLGGARGVDSQAAAFAGLRGIYVQTFVADWRLGKRAGPNRNQRMVDACSTDDVCIAFPDAESVGTWDCVRRARAKGMTVIVVEEP